MTGAGLRHAVVFAKAPRMGRVKTRLARDVGPVRAAAFYRRALGRVLKVLAADPRWTTWLAVSPDAAVDDPAVARLAAGLSVQAVPQGGGDLGTRMDRMMRRLPPGPAVIVGSDVPELRAALVWRAFEALGGIDAVFGPAPDGGYWLVGFKRSPNVPRPFSPVRWSGEHALADTLANLPRGCRTAFVDTLGDVDTGADLDAFEKRTAGP